MADMDYSRVAHLYDAYIRTDFDVPFFFEETRGASQVLELMSGTGGLSIPLVEVGVNLTCVDRSPEMLAVLREKLAEKGLSACVHEADVCELSLDRRFDLILLPFHGFAEILDVHDQRRALARIRGHLDEGGRFICTLHNPVVRRRSVDGQLRQRGQHPLPDGQGTLFLSGLERLDTGVPIVGGTQFYEVYDGDGVMRSKSFLNIRFHLHEREGFEELIRSAGFTVLDLYGDYWRGPFVADASPFMIWSLGGRKR